MKNAMGEQIIELWWVRCPVCNWAGYRWSASNKKRETDTWDTFRWIGVCERCGGEFGASSYKDGKKIRSDVVPAGCLMVGPDI